MCFKTIGQVPYSSNQLVQLELKGNMSSEIARPLGLCAKVIRIRPNLTWTLLIYILNLTSSLLTYIPNLT